MQRRIKLLACLVIALAASVAARAADRPPESRDSAGCYSDFSNGRDWPGYGRTFGQQHFSPLEQINHSNISRLGLAWWLDLDPLKNAATQPIAVDGVLYFATGLSIINAVDAANGRRLWRYDPRVGQQAGLNLRYAWGVRGVAWWNGKIYTGTQDGRLIAIDAKRGVPVWTARTFDSNYPAHINGAPRVFNGKVIIGYASSTGATRGFVTTYDADTGKKLWRFYTVPGNPAEGFENPAMAMAAKTWAGKWWEKGGGGADVWNAIAYDPETNTVFIGTGSAFAENRKIRSNDQGDNLFVSSIIALDGNTGAYKWHYQTTPGDTWDFDATMDIELADLIIAGKPRKVLMQAPKNGFFYVIDRLTGKLISAEPYTKVTWATHIDLKTGRPVETPGARYPKGTEVEIWPTGVGGHSWMPMAYNPKAGLAFIPQIEAGWLYTDKGLDLASWRPPTDRGFEVGFEVRSPPHDPGARAALVAWNPVTQKEVWRVSHPTWYNGGILTTGGGLVFQGTIDGSFKSYAATTGKELWSFAAQAPLIAPPISYTVNGEQYVTLMTGLGMGILAFAGTEGNSEKYHLDARSQARRVLTFKLGGEAKLPPIHYAPLPPITDMEFKDNPASTQAGQATFDRFCDRCHGPSSIAVIQAPDLRRSGILLSPQAFKNIVHEGASVSNGMPKFGEFTDRELADLRQYLRSEAQRLRTQQAHP